MLLPEGEKYTAMFLPTSPLIINVKDNRVTPDGSNVVLEIEVKIVSAGDGAMPLEVRHLSCLC